MRSHRLGDPSDEGGPQAVAETATDDDGLHVQEVVRVRDRQPERPDRVVDEPRGHVVATLEGFVDHSAGEPIAAALLHEVEEDRPSPAGLQAAGVGFHAGTPGVGLQTAPPPAAAAPAPLLDDGVADLAGCAAAVPQLAVQDHAPAHTSADEDTEDIAIGAAGSADELTPQ